MLDRGHVVQLLELIYRRVVGLHVLLRALDRREGHVHELAAALVARLLQRLLLGVRGRAGG